MNKKLVFNYLGKLLILEAVLMLPSFLISLYYRDGDQIAILASIGITCLVGLILSLAIRPAGKDIYTREGVAVAGLGWIAMSVLGSLPFVFSGVCNFWDAFFEVVSGFTTTGATILTDVEAVPRAILFWRSFTHWIGGMGVLVLTTALLPSIGGKGAHLARAETPGPAFSKIRPKVGDSAKTLYIIYAALTVLLYFALRIAGMSVFDAVTHAFGTAGTGGFSTRGLSVGAYDSVAIDMIIAVFMLLFGINFAVYFKLLSRDFKGAFKGEETYWYFGLVGASTILIALNIHGFVGSFWQALRQSFFQVTSIVSTTGYSTADFNLWPPLSQAILLFLMIGGSCAGSTAGGLKLVRLMLLFKMARREVIRSFQPRKVNVVKLDGKSISEEMLGQIALFFVIYMLLLIIGGIAMAADGADVVSAFTGSLACISNIGPGLGMVGPMGSFAFFSPVVKVLCSFLMLAGRLEIFPIMALIHYSFWKHS